MQSELNLPLTDLLETPVRDLAVVHRGTELQLARMTLGTFDLVPMMPRNPAQRLDDALAEIRLTPTRGHPPTKVLASPPWTLQVYAYMASATLLLSLNVVRILLVATLSVFALLLLSLYVVRGNVSVVVVIVYIVSHKFPPIRILPASPPIGLT